MKIINESAEPMEGYFWYIDSKIVGYAEAVPRYGYEVKQSKTHEATWNQYRTDDNAFDYYPRGRVMTDPNLIDNKFAFYSSYVFLDPCIDNKEVREQIKDYYKLDLVQEVSWFGNLKQRAGMDHYTCHQCRGE